jgi:hypothetical protein
VADERTRLDAPRAPERRQRPLDEKERGELKRRTLEAVRGRFDGVRLREKKRWISARCAGSSNASPSSSARRYTGSLA